MRFPKIKTIKKEIIDNSKKIESNYKIIENEKIEENKNEEIEEKPIDKKPEEKKLENEKLEETKVTTIENNSNNIEKDTKIENDESKTLQEDSQGIMRLTDKALGTTENTQQIIFRDASSVIAEKLPEQLGTDPLDIKRGRYDVRRLTNISPLERVWIGYFDLLSPFEGGEWAKDYANEYMNLSMSIGGERAKLLVKMQMAAGGGQSQFKKPEDKRNFIERHFTKRGQEPKEDDINEL